MHGGEEYKGVWGEGEKDGKEKEAEKARAKKRDQGGNGEEVWVRE
jgi:hypothetical protein